MKFSAVVISANLPGQERINLGVLVLDEGTDRIHLRFRTDIKGIGDSSDAEVIRGIPEMLESMAVEMGAVELLQYLEDWSNVIRSDPRITILADDAVQAVERAFAEYVA